MYQTSQESSASRVQLVLLCGRCLSPCADSQDVGIPSNETSIKWRLNTFDATIYVNVSRIFKILESFQARLKRF
jgi:hypothetical protein